MRDFAKPGRSDAYGANGMVATSSPAATLAGLDVLREGGNAVDAAVAAAAVLAVVEPTQTGIGGDCFVLMKKEGQPVIALNGAGRTPAALDFGFFAEHGISVLDDTSVHAITVPGAIRTWAQLLADHGSRDWARLLETAIEAAGEGYAVTDRLGWDWAQQVDRLARDANASAIFLPSGRAPVPGQMHRQPALASTLRRLAAEGPDIFYEGWLASEIVAELRRHGGLHTEEDFAAFAPVYEAPISRRYRDCVLWECPPSGQGIVALAMAAVLDQSSAPTSPMSAERFHLLAEAARIAYAERDLFLCDPETASVPVAHLVSDERASSIASRIGKGRRLNDLAPFLAPPHRDTVYISVVDRDRTAVSFINSLFDFFGTGISTSSGILMHNRACGFVLDPDHPNCIAGGKRPLHTIIPAMLTRDSEAVMAFGVTGAHFQPLGQIQILTNLLDYGMSVQEAIDFPRMSARGEVFEIESTVPQTILDELQAMGHRPTRPAAPLGSSQAIWIDRREGVLRGGADPRRDGIALGY